MLVDEFIRAAILLGCPETADANKARDWLVYKANYVLSFLDLHKEDNDRLKNANEELSKRWETTFESIRNNKDMGLEIAHLESLVKELQSPPEQLGRRVSMSVPYCGGIVAERESNGAHIKIDSGRYATTGTLTKTQCHRLGTYLLAWAKKTPDEGR